MFKAGTQLCMELQRNSDSMLSRRLSDMLVNHGLEAAVRRVDAWVDAQLMLACSDQSSACELQWKWYRETWVC